jgi:hypothetical protein
MMSEPQKTSEAPSAIERLIRDLFDTEDVVFTITSGDNFSIAELMGKETPVFQGGWWSVETPEWHIHAQVSAIQRIRFVREPGGGGEESLSIHFGGPHGEALLGCYFTRLYDQGQPVAARFGRWEELRAKYGGQDEVPVENGAIVTARG